MLWNRKKTLKAIGGVIWLDAKTLNRFCLTTPILNGLSDKYCKKYDIWYCSKRKSHYQLTGSHLNRLCEICEKVQKLTAEMGNCDATFCNNDAVFNVTSKAVLPEDCAKELLQHESIGNEIYQEYSQTRLEGKESIWSTITKRKFKTF